MKHQLNITRDAGRVHIDLVEPPAGLIVLSRPRYRRLRGGGVIRTRWGSDWGTSIDRLRGPDGEHFLAWHFGMLCGRRVRGQWQVKFATFEQAAQQLVAVMLGKDGIAIIRGLNAVQARINEQRRRKRARRRAEP